MSTPKQGEVYDFDFGPQLDNRQEGKRPAVVIQTDMLNDLAGYSLTIIVPVSTKGRNSPSHVRLEADEQNGLDSVSFAKCEQLYTVPKAQLGRRRGRLKKSDWFAIREALRMVLEL